VIRSVDEALANVMRHAYGGQRDMPIHLTCWSVASKLPQGAKAALESSSWIAVSPCLRKNCTRPRRVNAARWLGAGVDAQEHGRRRAQQKRQDEFLRMLKYAV